MELVSHVVPQKTKGKDTFLLMPVGDIQWYGDRKGVALGMLKRHIAWGVKNGAWFLGMGDYSDAFSPSNAERLRNASLYDTAKRVIDDASEKLVRELYAEALAPSKGRWLGMLEGHHYHTFRNGMTSDMLLADMLQAKFLGTSAYVRLVFQYAGNHRGSVVIWCHHGRGSGKSLASPINYLEGMASSYAGDIFLMGHQHKKIGGPIDYIEPVWSGNGEPSIRHRTKILACTGSFLKGLVVGSRDGIVPRGGYVEQGMMRPVSLGGVLVRIRPRWVGPGLSEWLPDMSVES